ncbi:UNVERIFIED_CONTAM: hypothetical protein B566_EDAN019377, partial [Ephemera danica]
MTSESPPCTILCEEVFDENSQPSEDEIRDYAYKIGIDPDSEPQLLPLARDGLMKALPSSWTPCFDHKKKAWYYFNYDTGVSQWEHPLDCVYRDLVRKNRSESASSAGEDDSKTSAKEDLRSFEEVAGITPDSAHKLDLLKPSGTLLRRATTQLAPLQKLPARLEPLLQVGDASKHRHVPHPPPSPTPIPGTSKADDKLQKAQEKHPKSMHGCTELTLSGGGTSFLKKPAAHSSDSSTSDGLEEHNPAPVWTKPSILAPPRGILRDKSPQREAVDDERQQLQRQDLEEERKSVRFNLEEGDGLQIRFLEEEDEYPSLEPKKFPKEPVTICLHPPEPEDGWNSDEEDTKSNSFIKPIEVTFSPVKGELKGDAPKAPPRKGSHSSSADKGIPHTNNGAKSVPDANAVFELERQKLLKDVDKRILDLKQKIKIEEENEIQIILDKKQERLVALQESVRKELETREANIRDGAERTLEQLREELATSMEQQLAAVRAEKQAVLTAEEAALRKLKDEAQMKMASVRKELCDLHEERVRDEKMRLEQENEVNIDKLRQKLLLEHDKQVSELSMELEEQKTARVDNLKKELSFEEEKSITNMKQFHEQNMKERISLLEKTNAAEIAAKQAEMDSVLKEKIALLQKDMEQQLNKVKENLAEDHNKAVDKIKTEQLIALENLRASLQRDEEEMQAAHKVKVTNVTERLNAEYEARLRRLREAAERKSKMLEEQETTAKFEQHGTVASLSRNTADVDNSIASHQRCEQLQRQIELLSIKLRETRKQLEEAKASRPDDRVFEKLRCEKRLLEDKYRTLKDKYVRLKSDVKQSLEKRNKKRLAAENNRATTGSETDRSTSQKNPIEKPAPPPRKLAEDKPQESILEESEANNNNTQVSSIKESLFTSPPPTDSSDRTSPPPPPVALRRARRHQTKLKSSSTPRLDRTRENANPVENLRTQLKKLEDLEDLFPASTHTDTYLRYPFSDAGQVGSCELEFFRHRIHLERDSVQRAKEFLKQQRLTFSTRQRELRQRQSQITSQTGGTRLHSELLRDSVLQ